MSKTKSVLLVAAVALATLAGVSVSVFFYAQTLHVDPVPCPTEDSCVPDYHDGAWHIEPTVP